MTDVKRYAVGHPLAFFEAIHVARSAVAAGFAEGPDRAALVVRGHALALLPAHARGQADHWQARTAEDWIRSGAYAGVLDAWNRSAWRAASGPAGADGECFAAAYTVAWSAANNEIARLQTKAQPQEVHA